MSANNIVVIKKEPDGKFRGYHRDYDCYCEGQYDYEGPCQCCEDGCDMCDGKGYYTPLESVPIFVVYTIEEAVHAYYKWYKEMEDSDEFGMFTVEYGFRFEGLEPKAETIEAFEELDSQIVVKDNLKWVLDRIRNTTEGFTLVNCDVKEVKEKLEEVLDHFKKVSCVKTVDSINELIEDLEQPDDIELLEFIHRNYGKKPGDKCWCYDCPGAFDTVGKPRVDCQVCDGSGSIPEEWFRQEFKEKEFKTDIELLDFLQQQTDKAEYSGKVICRDSTTGRGWRLLETTWEGAVPDVRQAIINYMKLVKEELK